MSVRVSTKDNLHRALAQGGEIILLAGVHTGSFEAATDVVIIGEEGAVLDANGRGSVLLVQEDDLTVVVEGVTLRNGHAELGAGLCLVANSQVTLRKCRLEANRPVQLRAGGVGVAAGSVTLDRCELGEGDDVWVLAYGHLSLLHTQIPGQVAVMEGATAHIDGSSVGKLRLRGSPRATPTATVTRSGIAEVDNDEAMPGNLIIG
ncbi:MAG: hypothetical protein ACJARS_004383 [bacterium]